MKRAIHEMFYKFKPYAKQGLILLFIVCLISYASIGSVVNAETKAGPSQYLLQRLNADKTIVERFLPAGAKANFKISDNKIITIFISFPANYGLDEKIRIVRSIQKSIMLEKLGRLQTNKEGKYISAYPFSADYYLTGQKTFNGYQNSTIYNSINTVGHVINYIDYKKISITGTAAGIIQNPPPNYEGIGVDFKIHVWGLGLSISFPPSGNIVEKTFSNSTYRSAPHQYAVINDFEYVCYGLDIYRFGQDQYVKIHRGGFTDSYWYYLGRNVY